jgi:hypothetical protein
MWEVGKKSLPNGCPIVLAVLPVAGETFSKPAKSCAEQCFLVTLTFKKSKKGI